MQPTIKGQIGMAKIGRRKGSHGKSGIGGTMKERVGDGSMPITSVGGIPGKVVTVESEYDSGGLE